MSLIKEETEVKTKREIIENIDGEINYVKEKLPKMDREKSEGRKEWHEGYLVAMKEARNKVNQLDEPETLTPEWIDEHKQYWTSINGVQYYVPVDDLKNLLVPKQEEVDQAYKDGYEKGKQYTFYKGYLEGLADKEKEPETVADVVSTFWKSFERLKEVMNMEVEELEE